MFRWEAKRTVGLVLACLARLTGGQMGYLAEPPHWAESTRILYEWSLPYQLEMEVSSSNQGEPSNGDTLLWQRGPYTARNIYPYRIKEGLKY